MKLRKLVATVLSLPMILTFCPSLAASYPPGTIISSEFDEESGTLTLETSDNNIYEIVVKEENGMVICQQYNNGVLFDEVSTPLPQPEQLYNTPAPLVSGTYYGTVHYTGGMNPTYTMSVDVLRSASSTAEWPTVTYTPPSVSMTLAQLTSDITLLLGLPMVFASKVAGLVVAALGIISEGYIRWYNKTNPPLTCRRFDYSYTLVHHGTAPVYYEGEEIQRYGSKYLAYAVDDYSKTFLNETYNEGLVIESRNAKSAEYIYYALYYYPQWSYIKWTS